mmetsp:Transcript_144643/g.462441  ORF Transcript_144643/g.462441 Transcript_144643/m.462441 type:complete len:148 (+) Transcript_144643:2-445(+)
MFRPKAGTLLARSFCNFRIRSIESASASEASMATSCNRGGRPRFATEKPTIEFHCLIFDVASLQQAVQVVLLGMLEAETPSKAARKDLAIGPAFVWQVGRTYVCMCLRPLRQSLAVFVRQCIVVTMRTVKYVMAHELQWICHEKLRK